MKKIVFCFLFTFLTICTLSAQKKFSFGFTGGVNISSQRAINIPDLPLLNFNEGGQWIAGVQGGIVTNYYFNTRLGLAANLLFSQKGYQIDQENPAFFQTTTFRYHYLNLPLMVRFHPIAPVFIEGGIEWGHLLSAKAKTPSDTFDLKELNFLKNNDLGLVVGLGIAVSNKLVVNVRYVHGIINIQEPLVFTDANGQPIEDSEDISFQNRSIQLSLNASL